MPCLVGGGFILTMGWSDHYFINFVTEPEYNLPLTMIYISLGYIGMTLGFAVPFGRIMGTKIERVLPKWRWKLGHTWVAGYILVLSGTLVNIIGFFNGLLGFQKFDQVEAYDGLIFFLLTMFFQGYFLLWYSLFRTPKKDASYLITLALLILLVPMRMAIMGNRGSIYLCILPIAFAYIVSGSKVTIKHGILFGAIIVVSIFIGMVYGTNFRSTKGAESRLSAGDYIGQIEATLDNIGQKDFSQVAGEASYSLFNRLENLSSVGVIVANYEKLAPYEESYGLANNILRDTYTSLIPRFVWVDKPLTSDAHAYSDLYFNFEDNAFAITPWGDLLRNFGPYGVPAGMFLLGLFLRTLYVTLGTQQDGYQWRSAAYYLLLTTVSYEAFYATLLPSLLRVGLVLAATTYLTNLIAHRTRGWRMMD
jgi:hypothetical protein